MRQFHWSALHSRLLNTVNTWGGGGGEHSTKKLINNINLLLPLIQIQKRETNMVVDYWCTHTLDNNTNSHITLEFGLPRLVLSSFFSAEWFGTEFREFASIFVPRNGIPSCFLFRWSVRKGIQRDIFYFLLNGTEFRVLFSSAEGFGTEFRDFLFRGTAGIPSEITLCSVYSAFRGIIFLSEIPNPNSDRMQIDVFFYI